MKIFMPLNAHIKNAKDLKLKFKFSLYKTKERIKKLNPQSNQKIKGINKIKQTLMELKIRKQQKKSIKHLILENIKKS